MSRPNSSHPIPPHPTPSVPCPVPSHPCHVPSHPIPLHPVLSHPAPTLSVPSPGQRKAWFIRWHQGRPNARVARARSSLCLDANLTRWRPPPEVVTPPGWCPHDHAPVSCVWRYVPVEGDTLTLSLSCTYFRTFGFQTRCLFVFWHGCGVQVVM